MDFMGVGRILTWVVATAVFAACWAWAISSWGLLGLYVGWIPALIPAPLAAVAVSSLWSVIGLTALLGWHFHACERDGDFGPETPL